MITYNGITKSIAEWSKETGLTKQTIYDRIRRYGICDKVFVPLYCTNADNSTFARKDKIISLYNQGLNSSEIVKETGIRKCRIEDALKRWNLI